MYVASDPRSQLAKAAPASTNAPRPLGGSTYARFYDTEPNQTGPQHRTWLTRGENFIVAYCETQAGASFARSGQPDEYMILLPDPESLVEIDLNGTTTACSGHAVVFVPPGDSTVRVLVGGRVVQFFTSRAQDLAEQCGEYEVDPNVAPFEPWPEPVGGFRVRTYSMDVPQQEGRFGRLLRSTTFMVNYIYPRSGPRARNTMSPHSHEDFQQISLCLEGSYVHHLRWPWGNDADQWRPDEHAECGAPSVTIIPARVLHTSEASAPGTNFLIDVFCPPRVDFSRQPGWVLNADEYPEPASA